MSKTSSLYKVQLKIISGNGGNGCVSFRRERKVPKGGPDGGDGGRGGNIYVTGDSGIMTLQDFMYKRIWRAKNGQDGSGQNKKGRSADDLVIKVPVGTQIINSNDEVICDVIDNVTMHLIARGGHGGMGNQHFATPELQAPAIAKPGELGIENTVWLVLKYMADIGVVGLPNAGKSTFVHLVSRAKVTIGDYAFSTINPVLGTIPQYRLVIADLPGLIEGAHNNIGLGHEFLQHIERCKIILHVISADDPEYQHSFQIIRNELAQYNPKFLDKEYYVCISKTDLADPQHVESMRQYLTECGYKVVSMSDNVIEGLNIVNFIVRTSSSLIV